MSNVLVNLVHNNSIRRFTRRSLSSYHWGIQCAPDCHGLCWAHNGFESCVSSQDLEGIRKDLTSEIQETRARQDQIKLLAPRERETVSLVWQADSNQEIAQALEIFVKTVEKHRGNAMKKLGVKNKVQLIRAALKEKLIRP